MIGKVDIDKKMSISISREKGSRFLMFPKCKTAKRSKNAEKEMRKASKSVKAS